jgi:hypothetical protein
MTRLAYEETGNTAEGMLLPALFSIGKKLMGGVD